jgi:hypothetical protein
MAIPRAAPFPLTGDGIIDGMTHGYSWQIGSSREIKWSISDGFVDEFWIDPSGVQASLEAAFEVISAYADISFVYAGYWNDPVTAHMRGSDINVSMDGHFNFFTSPYQWALGLFPDARNDEVLYSGASGDIYLNLNSEANYLSSYEPGSAGWFLILHEIGHTLGLKHPFDDGGTGRPTFLDLDIDYLDVDWATVMSYDDDYGFNSLAWDPATPMVLDVLALQYLYGPNLVTNAGDTVHNIDSYDLYYTIWDPSGEDVIDSSSSAQGWSVYLPAAHISSLVPVSIGLATPVDERNLPAPQNLVWLMGEIEHTTGSDFVDYLEGNDLDNHLYGLDGSDSILGGTGSDRIVGGPGNDRLVGGAGADTFVFDDLFGSDNVTDFLSRSDRLQISNTEIRLGDGDDGIDGAATVAGGGGFAPTAELVIVTANIAGSINAGSAAARIGNATAAYQYGSTVIFAVDNGQDSAVYLFTSSDSNAKVEAHELRLLAALQGTPSTATVDYSLSVDRAVIEVDNVVVDEGSGFAEFTYRVAAPVTEAIELDWYTSGLTADSGADFTSVYDQVVLQPGQTDGVFRVAIRSDATPESNEMFAVNISVPDVDGNSYVVATALVLDDDAYTGDAPTLLVGDVYVDENDGVAKVTLALSAPSGTSVSLRTATRNGSAMAGQDYEALRTQTVTFAPGELTKTISVGILDDGSSERAEYFDVIFASVQGAPMPDTRARIFIGPGDSTPQSTPVVNVLPSVTSESDGYAEFLLVLSEPMRDFGRVSWIVSERTAAWDDDVVIDAGDIYFGPGDTQQILRVALVDDSTPEAIEQFVLRLDDPVKLTIGTETASGIVVDDDHAAGTPLVLAHDVVVDEKAGLAQVTVQLDRPSESFVSLNYATYNGTATTTLDFTVQPSQVMLFEPGQMTRTISIPLVDDALAEGPEFFDIILSAPVNAALADSRVRVVIASSDQPVADVPIIAASPAVAVENEGVLEFAVMLSAPATDPVAVDWGASSYLSTASSATDYDYSYGSLTFAPGETVKLVQIPLWNDAIAESSETLSLYLHSASNALIAQGYTTGTILDDDGSGTSPWNIAGGAYPNYLVGAAGDDVILGGVSDDILAGEAGEDRLAGDAGNDLLMGGAENDALLGGAGNDVLDGGSGNDSMGGGAGNDVYIVDSASDHVEELPGEGTDTVRPSFSWTLGPNFEILTIAGTANRAGTGNAQANLMIGNAGDNLLRGRDGDDTLKGRAGSDTLQGDNGNDVLEGEAGSDILTGGVGADVFRFTSPVIPGELDTLTDFVGSMPFRVECDSLI